MLPKPKRFLVLAFAAIAALCLGGDAFAAESDGCCDESAPDSCQHCLAHCGCHTAAVAAGTALSLCRIAEFQFVPSDELKLPLVLETISTPPKR